MSTDGAQSPDRDEGRAKVVPGYSRHHLRPSSLNDAKSEKAADGSTDYYFPEKWSWGPPRSSKFW